MKEIMQRFAVMFFLLALITSVATTQGVAKETCKKGESAQACKARVNKDLSGTLPAPKSAGSKSKSKAGTLPAPPGLTQVDPAQWRVITLNGIPYSVTVEIGPTRDHYQIVWEDHILKYLLAGGDPRNPQFCASLGQFSAEGRAVYLDSKNKTFMDAANINCGNGPYMKLPAGPGVNVGQTSSTPPPPLTTGAGTPPPGDGSQLGIPDDASAYECITWIADYNKSAMSAENHQQTCELAQKIQEKKACKKWLSDNDSYTVAAKYQTCAQEGLIVESWRLNQFVYKCDQTDIPGDVCNFASKPLKYGAKGITYYVLPACQLLGNSSDPCMVMDKLGFDNYADRGAFNGALGTGAGLLDGPVQPGAGASNPALGFGNQLAPGQDDLVGAITVVGPDNTFNPNQIIGSGPGGVWPTPNPF